MDVKAMRRDWDRRARANPLYAIDASRRDWDREDFYLRGLDLVEQLVDPVLRQLGVDPAGKRVLEIGCGMGRLFEGLLGRFEEVWGIDVSAEMIEQGKAQCPVTARWFEGDGSHLNGVADESVDHVLSFEVLQHIPDPQVVRSYQSETFRVLRPGGTFQLQMRGGSDNIWQSVLRVMPPGVRRVGGSVLRAAGAEGIGGGIDTWIGCIVPPASAEEFGRQVGFVDVRVLPDRFHRRGMGYWLIGRKPG